MLPTIHIGLLVVTVFVALCDGQHPNIVFIVADDLGWNDLGFRNKHVISPNIDKLAGMGMILDQSYVQPVCTPSRTAFMTGVYPFKVGQQHLAMLPAQPSCAAMDKVILPQKLKENGYSTHMLGKWHLGFCKWECTPTYRGFDSFYGYYNGQVDYYNYTILNGTDFRDNKQPIRPKEYSTFEYAKRADEILRTHNKSQPLFLYYAFQSVHEPIEVPKSYEDKYSWIKNEGRRKYLGMVTALDDAIGNLTESLKQAGLFDNTLIIFTSDNGGWPQFFGNNYPLRGSKISVYEGGTRASAFVSGKGIKNPGTTYKGLMHAVDWMPTILSAAGVKQDSSIDGIDMWDSLQNNNPSKRTEFIYNLDDKTPELTGHAAIRMGDYKLIEGNPGLYHGWYPPPEDESILDTDQFNEIPLVPQLYNLKEDPNEHNNLFWKEREIYKKLNSRMEEYKKDMVPADYPGNDKKSAPSDYGGYWTPGWC